MTWVATEKELDEPLYPAYMPTSTTENWPPTEPFVYEDPALRADTALPDLLVDGAVHKLVTPKFGTEISGLQLTQLSATGLDQLALLVAQRGFVVFRGQDWKDSGFKKQLDIARHFGPLHKHPVHPRPATETEISVVYQSAADVRRPNYWGDRMSGINWHVDQSYEAQPPCYTFFGVLENQGWVGGDTLMSDMSQAVEHMSPIFRDMLTGQFGIHSSYMLTNAALRDGGALRKPPVEIAHPIITEHPVTKEKCLYVNSAFTTRIQGLKTEESDSLLKFLLDYVTKSADFSARVKWEEGTVIVWDQRKAQHTATLDTLPGKRRHMIRITPLGGKPIAATKD
ncbi:hypothetical protein IAT38_001007 [Cryptococcus sp. DSM 104549]